MVVTPQQSSPTHHPLMTTNVSSSSEIRELIALVRRQSEKIEKLETKITKMERPGSSYGASDTKSIERLAQELKRTNQMLMKLPLVIYLYRRSLKLLF